jgi:hypothetical protein
LNDFKIIQVDTKNLADTNKNKNLDKSARIPFNRVGEPETILTQNKQTWTQKPNCPTPLLSSTTAILLDLNGKTLQPTTTPIIRNKFKIIPHIAASRRRNPR